MSNFGTFSGKERIMHTETRLRPFIYVDGIRHEIISPPDKVNVLIGARVVTQNIVSLQLKKTRWGRTNNSSE